MDLNKTYDNINLEFPGKFKVVGIGIEQRGYDEFKKGGYFKHTVYIDKLKQIYKKLKYKKPGILSCFGFCVKNFVNEYKNVTAKYKDKNLAFDSDLKKDVLQMGGSFLINRQGKVLFEHIDTFYGDHAKEEQISEVVRSYFQNENLESNQNY